MSSHSLYDRSHPSASASSSSSRQQLSHPPPASARRTSYSSLNEALGSTRQPEQPYPHQFHPSDTPITAQMSSDGRYMYQHPPGMSSYEYPPNYSSANYNPPQFPQNPPRAPPRTASAQSQSPSQQAYNPPQPPYHQPYGSASYSGIPPPPSAPPPQWNGEGWSQYGQPFSAPPIQEAPVVEGQGRTEPAPSPAVQRAYPPPVQASPDVHRNPELAPAVAPSPQPKRKQRDQEPPRQPSPPAGLDFRKLLESYRVIIDTTRSLVTDPNTQGRPPPPDALHRMLQSAHYGFQVLGAAAGPPPAPPTPTEPLPPPPVPVPVPVPAPAKAGEEGEGVAVKRQKSEGPVPEGQTCLGCNATSTPEWRRGPLGPRTLCNACGLVYAKLIKKRNREAARKAGARGRAESGSVPPDESGAPSSGEEDEDSYTGSQEFRSELGDHGGGR